MIEIEKFSPDGAFHRSSPAQVFQAICEAFLAIYVPALALNASLRSGNADGGEWGL